MQRRAFSLLGPSCVSCIIGLQHRHLCCAAYPGPIWEGLIDILLLQNAGFQILKAAFLGRGLEVWRECCCATATRRVRLSRASRQLCSRFSKRSRLRRHCAAARYRQVARLSSKFNSRPTIISRSLQSLPWHSRRRGFRGKSRPGCLHTLPSSMRRCSATKTSTLPYGARYPARRMSLFRSAPAKRFEISVVFSEVAGLVSLIRSDISVTGLEVQDANQ